MATGSVTVRITDGRTEAERVAREPDSGVVVSSAATTPRRDYSAAEGDEIIGDRGEALTVAADRAIERGVRQVVRHAIGDFWTVQDVR